MPEITPCLWFDGRLQEAVDLYRSVFEGADAVDVDRYPPGAPDEMDGQPMTAVFEIAGQKVMLLNGGPQFPQTEAFSFSVSCADQAELDRVWDGLLAGGGTPSQCGWLKDRFGVSWQVVPEELARLMSDPDPERAGRVAQAVWSMVKLDIAPLRAAYDGTT